MRARHFAIWRTVGVMTCAFAEVGLGSGPALGAWKPLGPFGGTAEAIAQDPANPDTLLAGARGGILYKTTNGGSRWSSVSFPRSFADQLHVIAVAEGQPSQWLLAVTPGAKGETGLYRSTSAGESWDPVEFFRNKTVYSLAVFAKNARILCAGANDGVYLSADQGTNWKRISPESNTDLQSITSLAFDPESSSVIYAGTGHLPWKTSDSGKTWTSMHHGMIDDSDVFSIETDPTEHGHVYASACSGIYATHSAGTLWSKLFGIPRTSRRTYAIRQDPSDPKIVVAATSQGFWRSSDRGATWKEASSIVARAVVFDRKRIGRLYLATEETGPMISEDHGLTFKPINEGFVNRGLTNLAEGDGGLYSSSPYSPGFIYRLGANEIWTSIGEADTKSFGHLLGVYPVNQSMLLGFTTSAAVRTPDGGKTYVQAGPKDAHRMRAMTLFAKPFPSAVLGSDEGLYWSGDWGDHWEHAVNDSGPVEGIYSGNSETAVAEFNDRLLISRDSGRHWSPITAPVSPSEIYDVAVGVKGVLLAGTARGAFRTADWGKSWTAIRELSDGTIRAVAFDPSQSGAIAIRRGAAYWSQDMGSTWTPLDSTGLEGVAVRGVAIPSSFPGKAFVLTQFRGIFVSDLPGSGRPAEREPVSQTHNNAQVN
ncbi:MAG TPA: hypothetical protein VKB79_27245 [Bryobacteraceae bacterium]|nr:hypothetical protein [Bryobacteraceae bacterium]